jgi:hypothetical protein
MAGPAAHVLGDLPPITPHPHPLQIGGHLHAAADHRRVDRVVIAVQADVVVTRQPQRARPARLWRDRRQRQHRGPVSLDPVGGRAAQHPPAPLVDHSEPVGQLSVEVGRAGEGPAGQERGLQIPVGPLDQPLGLRIPGIADQHLGAQHPTKRMRLLGEDRLAPAPLADRALPIPHQHPRHRPQLVDELPPAGEQVLRGPRGNQPGGQPAGIAGHHHQHRQPGRGADLAKPHRQGDRREPQVALGDLPSRIGGP